MKLEKKSRDTVFIEASFSEKFNLAGVIRQSLIIRQSGIDIGTYSGVSREVIESIAQSVEHQVRDEGGLQLSAQNVSDIDGVFSTLKHHKYDISEDYGGYSGIDIEIREIANRCGKKQSV